MSSEHRENLTEEGPGRRVVPSEEPEFAVQHKIEQALAFHQRNLLSEADRMCQDILTVAPDNFAALYLLGLVRAQQLNYVESEKLISMALERNPTVAEAYINLGHALKQQGKLDEAVVAYRRALAMKPDLHEAHGKLGVALRQQGKLDEAVVAYRKAVAIEPDYHEAHYNLGNALRDRGELDEAVFSYRKALAIKPDFHEALSNVGNALKDQGKLDEAVDSYRKALAIKPDLHEAYCNLGNALKDQGKLDEAVDSYRRALAIKPDFHLAHSNLGISLLLRGDFQEGWKEYEWRFEANKVRFPLFNRPIWDGTPLNDKTIFLMDEQGLGDTIQFIRYAGILKGMYDCRIIAKGAKSLLQLLLTSGNIDLALDRLPEERQFDFFIPLLSLPGILNHDSKSFPRKVPYLFPSKELTEKWKLRLKAYSGYRVGICWKGSVKHKNDRNRSIPLDRFEAIGKLRGVRLFSLQKGEGVEQLEDVRGSFDVVPLGHLLEDFLESAAVVKNLDLVVTCDTALAHLAGALGSPVWLALPYIPDWRWMLGRDDSPWYPTMRIFRQETPGDWQGVFRRICQELEGLLPGRPTQGLADEPTVNNLQELPSRMDVRLSEDRGTLPSYPETGRPSLVSLAEPERPLDTADTEPENRRSVLNVGGGGKGIKIPGHYDNWKHDSLDIDPRVNPDVLHDARELTSMPPDMYDAVYCSHNLEHFHPHEVPKVLAGFLHVLKPDGFAEIRVPDLQAVAEHWIQNGMDIEDFLYQSADGPISIRDVFYGAHFLVRGNDFMCHKTGFTIKSLAKILRKSGFHTVKLQLGKFEVRAVAFKQPPRTDRLSLLGMT